MNKLNLTIAFAVASLLVACGKDTPVAPGTSSDTLLSSSIDIGVSSSVDPALSSSVDGASSSSVDPGVSSSSVAVVTPSSSSVPVITGSSSSVVVVPSSSTVVISSSSSRPSSSSVAVASSSSSRPSSSSVAVSSSSSRPSSSSSVVRSSSSIAPSSSSATWNPYNGNKSYGTMTDSRDGKVYKTIVIRGRTWLAQNLNYGTRVNGTLATDNQANDAVAEKYCYNDLEANCDKYGGLYQWAEAMALPASCNSTSCAASIATGYHQGICPTGWHVTKGSDIAQMTSNLAPGAEAYELKAGTDWSGGGIGTNSTGLTVLGAGSRKATELGGGFFNITSITQFWYAEEYDALGGKGASFSTSINIGAMNGNYKSYGTSIRCVQDY